MLAHMWLVQGASFASSALFPSTDHNVGDSLFMPLLDGSEVGL
jgi:hypothetical protein